MADTPPGNDRSTAKNGHLPFARAAARSNIFSAEVADDGSFGGGEKAACDVERRENAGDGRSSGTMPIPSMVTLASADDGAVRGGDDGAADCGAFLRAIRSRGVADEMRTIFLRNAALYVVGGNDRSSTHAARIENSRMTLSL